MPHNHFGIFHFLKNKEINELYACISIRTFAIAMAGIFIPVYLYQLGYSFSSIFLFFALAAFFDLIFLIPSAKIASKFGLKHTMLTSMFFLMIFFLLLFSLETMGWPLYLLAIFVGIHASLFWLSYHSDFAKFSDKKSMGKQVGFSKIAVSIFGALGPIIGGGILLLFGFKVLFVIVSVFLLASTFPLFLSQEVHEPMSFSIKNLFKDLKIREAFAYIGFGIEARLALVVWPLFIFVFIFSESYVSLGGASSLAFLFSIMSTFIISKFSDVNKRLFLKGGVYLTSIIWILKSFITLPVKVFIADSAYGISKTSTDISFSSLNYEKAKRRKILKTILHRETFIKVGAIVFLLTMSVFSNSFVEAFRYGGPISSLLKLLF